MVKILKNISVHPRLAATLDLFLSFIFLWWLANLGSWTMLFLWILLRLGSWFLLALSVYYPIKSLRRKHLVSLMVFALGMLFLLVFTEWKAGWRVLSAIFVFMPFFSFWILPKSKVSLLSSLKPHLRWRFAMSTVGLAGIFCAVGAILSFKIAFQVNVWVWFILAALSATAVSAWWWKEYGIVYSQSFLFWTFAFFILILQLLWATSHTSLGYFSLGFLLTWCWYVLWLFARYDLTERGIEWKKHRKFLFFNLFLFLIFLLLVVRWN